MATNDLMQELQKDSIKLDEDSERKVVNILLKMLEDKNGEVQNLAVKWYMHAHMHTASVVQSLFGQSVCLLSWCSVVLMGSVTMTATVFKKITSQLIGAMEKQRMYWSSWRLCQTCLTSCQTCWEGGATITNK